MRAILALAPLWFGWLACGGAAVGSIGAVLRADPDTGDLEVRTVPRGLAAAEAGLEPGDHIKMVDGILVDGLSADELRGLLRGPVGSSVEITVIRGETVLRVEVARQAIRERPTAAPIESSGER